MQVNVCNYVHRTVCKVELHSSGIKCGTRETYFKGKCSLMINPSPFLISPLSLETFNQKPPPPPPPPKKKKKKTLETTHHGKKTDFMMIHWNQGD